MKTPWTQRRRACQCGTVLSIYHDRDRCWKCEQARKRASAQEPKGYEVVGGKEMR